ncbi:MAG: FliM/FliN family flagellar motor switch protein [Myxococcota bacterium]|nr:FliM/FliN family flagellar motor switch protein [Myxococcota bacterium]
MSVNIAHLVNRSGQNQSALSRVERYFRAVSERFKARIVNRSTKDIPVRVADIDILTLGEVFANPEFREGTIFTQLKVQGTTEPGYIFLQVVLFNKLVNILLGGAMETVEVSVSAREFKGTNERLASRMGQELCEDMVRLKEGQPISLSPMRPTVNRPLITRDQKTQEVLFVTFDIGKVTEPLGLMSIIMPPSAFEDLLLLSNNEGIATGPVDLEHLGNVRLNLEVSLAETFQMTVSELTERLVEGETLELKDVGEALLVLATINGVPLYVGDYAENGEMRAVRILSPMTDELEL